MTPSDNIPADETAHTAEIARLNDATRSGTLRNSRMMMTRAVAEILGGDSTDDAKQHANRILNMNSLRQAILEAPIDPGNNPYGERDFWGFGFHGPKNPMENRLLRERWSLHIGIRHALGRGSDFQDHNRHARGRILTQLSRPTAATLLTNGA